MSVLVNKIFTKNHSDVHYFFTDFSLGNLVVLLCLRKSMYPKLTNIAKVLPFTNVSDSTQMIVSIVSKQFNGTYCLNTIAGPTDNCVLLIIS